jgi:hypothetical protein
VSTELHLDPSFAKVVKEARALARQLGEWEDGPFHGVPSPLSPEARRAVAQWLVDGSYDEAVAAIAATDPDLATQ